MHSLAQPNLPSNLALAAMLLLGNLFFFGCVASRHAAGPMDPPPAQRQPARMVLAGD